MLGFHLSEATVSRWMRRAPRSPHLARRWLTFLCNHREAIAAMDFFTVPTLTFGVLYCFFVIAHDRRRILHCSVTPNPQALWVSLRLREAWEDNQPQRFVLFDRDAKFGADVVSTLKAMGCRPLRTAFRSPWQNGVAERWVGSIRRDLLHHVIVLNQRHLRRLLNEYIRYYNYASYCPPRYVVGNSRPCCNDVGIAWSLLLLRTRSTNLAATSVSSAR
jgi:transposase InsO family protein